MRLCPNPSPDYLTPLIMIRSEGGLTAMPLYLLQPWHVNHTTLTGLHIPLYCSGTNPYKSRHIDVYFLDTQI